MVLDSEDRSDSRQIESRQDSVNLSRNQDNNNSSKEKELLALSFNKDNKLFT